MGTRIRLTVRCLGLAALLACGCGRSPPPLTEVEGTVLLNDKPLAQALVRFIPEAPGESWAEHSRRRLWYS